MSEERMLMKRLATPTTAPNGENDSEKAYCWQESENADSAFRLTSPLQYSFVHMPHYAVSESACLFKYNSGVKIDILRAGEGFWLLEHIS